ncbi:MAG: hypothetical protein ACKOX6_11410 [Bdellovibrio sp.]
MRALMILLMTLSCQAFATLSFDSGVPQNTQSQFSIDIDYAGSLNLSAPTPLHKKVFGTSNAPYGKFFQDRIFSVGYEETEDISVAFVSPWVDNKMFLTQNFLKFSHPQIARLMIFFHESRHTERSQSNWPHAYCPDPFLDKNGKEIKSIWTGSPLAGESGCDTTALGAYGTSVIMLKNVAKSCANCNDKVKMDADIYASDQLNRLINPAAVKQILSDLN